VFVALAGLLAAGVLLSGSGPKQGNLNAQVFAGTDINNVVGLAAEQSVTMGTTAVLTRTDLASAISGDRANPAGRLAHLTVRSLRAGRVTFSIDTPWQKNVCAWVPVSFSGPIFDWPVHFC